MRPDAARPLPRLPPPPPPLSKKAGCSFPSVQPSPEEDEGPSEQREGGAAGGQVEFRQLFVLAAPRSLTRGKNKPQQKREEK